MHLDVWLGMQVDFSDACKAQLTSQQEKRIKDWRMDYDLRLGCRADVPKVCSLAWESNTPLATGPPCALQVSEAGEMNSNSRPPRLPICQLSDLVQQFSLYSSLLKHVLVQTFSRDFSFLVQNFALHCLAGVPERIGGRGQGDRRDLQVPGQERGPSERHLQP